VGIESASAVTRSAIRIIVSKSVRSGVGEEMDEDERVRTAAGGLNSSMRMQDVANSI